MRSADTTGPRSWEVLLTAAAAADFQDIVRWTAEQFGESQARAYSKTLSAAIEALADGPTIIGAKPRDDIAKAVHALHVAPNAHRGRHFVMFRVAGDQDRPLIEVLRLLHDAMDLPRHLTATTEAR